MKAAVQLREREKNRNTDRDERGDGGREQQIRPDHEEQQIPNELFGFESEGQLDGRTTRRRVDRPYDADDTGSSGLHDVKTAIRH